MRIRRATAAPRKLDQLLERSYRRLIRTDRAFRGKDAHELARSAEKALTGERALQASIAQELRAPPNDGQALLFELLASPAVRLLSPQHLRRITEALQGNGHFLLPRLQVAVAAVLDAKAEPRKQARALTRMLLAFPDDRRMLSEAVVNNLKRASGDVDVVITPPRHAPRDGLAHPSVHAIHVALAALPVRVLALVERVVLHVGPDSPDRATRASIGGVPLMAAEGAVIHLYPQRPVIELDELTLRLAHEVGHVVARHAFGEADIRGKAWAGWRRAMESDVFAPSGYARQRPAEDFGEAFSWLMLAHGDDALEPRRFLPARAAIIDQILRSLDR